MRRLTWNDFRGPPLPTPPPKPGQFERAAEFKPQVSFTLWEPHVFPNSSPQEFCLPDNLTVTIIFDPATGRLATWLKSKCTAPGFLDNRFHYAARLKVWSCQAARMASG